MGNLLETPKTEKLHVVRYTSRCGMSAAATGMQGWRLEMEDAHIASHMRSLPDHTLLAVFDGHGGEGAAIYSAEHLGSAIESTPEWKSYMELSDKSQGAQLIGEALTHAFFIVDDSLRKHQHSNKSDKSGCTAVCAIISPFYIICSNAGDSRCVLGTNGYAKPMSIDHKPSDEMERTRIQNAGGSVQWKRVDGDLAVSRAFGDFQYKTHPTFHPKDQKVTCHPDIVIHTRTSEDEVIILACDGVWDVYSSEEAVAIARSLFASGERDMLLVTEELIDSAMHKGSKDNISAVVMQLSGAQFSDGGGVIEIRRIREAAQLSTNKSNGFIPPSGEWES